MEQIKFIMCGPLHTIKLYINTTERNNDQFTECIVIPFFDWIILNLHASTCHKITVSIINYIKIVNLGSGRTLNLRTLSLRGEEGV